MIEASQKSPRRALRLGLVGFGAHMEECLFPAIRATEALEITAVSSRSKDRARELAERHRIARYTDRWIDLVDPRSLDGLVVAGPPDLHLEVGSAALKAGLGIFVEKPPAPNGIALDRLVRQESIAPRCGFVGYNFRFAPGYLKLLERTRRTGTLSLARIRFLTSKPLAPFWHCRSVLESFLYAVGIHPIDMVLRLFGRPRGLAATLCPMEGTRFALQVELQFAAGATAVLELGNHCKRFESCIEVTTDRGTVGVLEDFTRLRISHSPSDNEGRIRPTKPSHDRRFADQRIVTRGYLAVIASFRDALRDGAPSPSPFANNVQAFEVIDEILVQCAHQRPGWIQAKMPTRITRKSGGERE